MMLRTTIWGEYQNIIEFVKDWNLIKEFKSLTGFEDDLKNWSGIPDLSNKEIIMRLLDRQRGLYALDYDDETGEFRIIEVLGQ